ncbi:hypothetical protein PHLCEN_2v6875 [Hermanssonia centrifuga]|uniref:NADAR domain-containing protein n=1 Tax=Hermanssonia centrifuga TaxID=98765 RepID=A0A2R6NY44_9APHY|nr:hypothetical protein PHLCEN_2v6875 [Hermanssonia centrifuga]
MEQFIQQPNTVSSISRIIVCPTNTRLGAVFQAHKFLTDRPDLAERIRNLSSARAVLQEATRLQRLRRHDWFEVNIDIMDSVLEAKFAQHEDLRRTLLETGSRELIEDSPVRGI